MNRPRPRAAPARRAVGAGVGSGDDADDPESRADGSDDRVAVDDCSAPSTIGRTAVPDAMLVHSGPAPAEAWSTSRLQRLCDERGFASRALKSRRLLEQNPPSDWGVTFETAAQLSSTLHRCDFHFAINISDAHRLSLRAGCGGELHPPDDLHIASRVDDRLVIMSTPEHGRCAGFEGGCSVCAEYHGRAINVQEMWHEKARKLNIPLPAKGHPVGQRGAYTGVVIDTFQGRFSMLPEKLESMASARDALRASAISTPRKIARVRNMALHYGCAIPFLAAVAASLSQAIHKQEQGVGPVDVPSIRDEDAPDFDWDQDIPVSHRAKVALCHMRMIMDTYGTVGQPIWPVVASSLYGAFMSGDVMDVRVLVITFDASVHGWCAIIRDSPDGPGIRVAGGFDRVAELLGQSFVDPASLPLCPVSQVYRGAIAGLCATLNANAAFALTDYTVIIRSECSGAISALKKGSFRSPVLQDIALIQNLIFVKLGAPPPLYLHVPGHVMKAEGVDDLSRRVAISNRGSESLVALRRIVASEAVARLGSPISIDLFATANNAFVPRFFARYAEPLAEGFDALSQSDWGRSRCTTCGQTHRECVFAFPPRALLPRLVAKARYDGMRGVVVVPFTPSDPVWPALAAASLTRQNGSVDPCIVVPNSETYVRPGDDLGGVHRLAIMAIDFSRWSSRSFAGLAAPCDCHRQHRPAVSRPGVLTDADRNWVAHTLVLFALQPHIRVKRPRTAGSEAGWLPR